MFATILLTSTIACLVILCILPVAYYRMKVAYETQMKNIDRFYLYERGRIDRFLLSIACLPKADQEELVGQWKLLSFRDYFIDTEDLYKTKTLFSNQIRNQQISDYRVDGENQLKELLAKKGLTLIE